MAKGRPKIVFNDKMLEELEKLYAIQCTDAEVAAFFGVSEDTIQRRKKDDESFLARYTKGKEEGKRSLRRLQWKSAEKGSIPMQIFLGKNILGQSDRQDIKHDIDERIQTLADVALQSIGKLRK